MMEERCIQRNILYNTRPRFLHLTGTFGTYYAIPISNGWSKVLYNRTRCAKLLSCFKDRAQIKLIK